MKFVICKKFSGRGLSGDVTIKPKTKLESDGRIVFLDGKPLFSVESENCHLFAAINDDGKGIERFKLRNEIKSLYASSCKAHDEALEALGEEPTEEQLASVPAIIDIPSEWMVRPGVFTEAFHRESIEALKQFLGK